MKKKQNIVQSVGKRKRAIARATLKEGKGALKINSMPLSNFNNQLFIDKVSEVLILAGDDILSKYDINIKVEGGGFTGQADAVRLAIGKALSEVNPELRDILIRYNRNFLVADTRRREARKPNCAGKARSKIQKSYR